MMTGENKMTFEDAQRAYDNETPEDYEGPEVCEVCGSVVRGETCKVCAQLDEVG
jgi:recombinational DNA repair protein RecR